MQDLGFLSQDAIRLHQNEQLQRLLVYLSQNSPFYKDHFQKHRINTGNITSVDQLHLLPVTVKDDLQMRNMDFLCVPAAEIIEYCSTSGTLGNPVTIALTENDLQRLTLNEYLSFKCAGATEKDIFLLMLTLDRQFMAGIAYFLGARQLGAGIIRGGPGNVAMHLDTINRLKPTVLVAVPSFVSGMIAYANANDIDLNKTSVKKIICIGDNIREETLTPNALGSRILDNWKVSIHSTYASTEQQTAFTECEYGCGGHHQPGLLIFEVLDENNRQVQPGENGELTVTTLGVEGMPLLRYKTGDICTYFTEPCKCGRHSYRISPIAGRKQQLVKYKGTTLYPQTIFNALNSIPEIADYAVKVKSDELGLDDLEIILALSARSSISDQQIRQILQSKLRIIPTISYLPAADIQQMQNQPGKRKLSKFIDER